MTKEIRYEGSVNLIFNSKSFTLSSPMQSQDVYFPISNNNDWWGKKFGYCCKGVLGKKKKN